MISGPEWIWVVLAVLVVFGASRLPLIGRNVGQGIKEFRKGVKEANRDDSKPVEGGAKDSAPTNTAEPSTPDRLADRRD
jgi:sec-independent protein translocase protein TatA